MSKELLNKNTLLHDAVSKDSGEETKRQFDFMEKVKVHVAELSRQLGRTPTACVVTFGCQMNARDSEKLLGVLTKVGFEETDTEDADFVIYNTCTVRDNADQRVFGRLGYVSGIKKKKPTFVRTPRSFSESRAFI